MNAKHGYNPALFNIIFVSDKGGFIFAVDWTGPMLAKISDESTGDDIYSLEVSDTNTQMVTALRAMNQYLRFYSYNGAFTLDTTIPTPAIGNGELINITTVPYIAFFSQNSPTKY